MTLPTLGAAFLATSGGCIVNPVRCAVVRVGAFAWIQLTRIWSPHLMTMTGI
jgi:hypothetical protein